MHKVGTLEDSVEEEDGKKEEEVEDGQDETNIRHLKYFLVNPRIKMLQ